MIDFNSLSPEEKIQFVHGLVRFVHKLASLIESEVDFEDANRTVFDEGFLSAATTSVQSLEAAYGISSLFRN